MLVLAVKFIPLEPSRLFSSQVGGCRQTAVGEVKDVNFKRLVSGS